MITLAHLRRFLENLPELADNSQFVKFTIFTTNNYRPFIRHCLSNTINLSQSMLGCVLRHKRHVTSSGRATGKVSKNEHHHGVQVKSRRRRATQEAPEMHTGEPYKELAQALSWEECARFHFRLATWFYLYQLFKNILIDSIGFGDLSSSAPSSSLSFMRDFRFLDCLLLGRFRFFGRTNKISAEIANIFVISFLVYRSVIHSTVPKFKFYAFEFLMSSHAEVMKHELKTRVADNGRDRLPSYQHGTRQTNHLFASQRQRASATAPTEMLGINSIYYLRSPFELQERKWILRLNRTGDSWLALNACTKLLIYWSLVTFLAWFALIYYALAGSILTNTGFEMSYPACVAWLRDLQNKTTTSNNYSHIYLAPKVLAHEIRIDDLPARIPISVSDFPNANLYNIARIASDAMDNHLLYLEFILIFIAQFFLLAISSIDVILNALGIKARLVSVLEKMAAHQRLAHEQNMRIQCYSKFIEAHQQLEMGNEQPQPVSTLLPRAAKRKSTYSSVFPVPHNNNKRHFADEFDDWINEGLTEEIADLQAILADHFDTITRGYNLFISFFVNFVLFTWLSYTLVICAWIGAVKSRAIEWEFLIAESGGTVFALILLAGAALVRSQNVQLYPLIARAMALDSSSSPTKARWTIILKYFHPKPFFCFTILGSTEVSLLLCLKLISWILSAFILLANFYYMNRF